MFSVVSVCLSVCLFVCQHGNFRTIKCGMMKLGGSVNCTKISPEFEFGVKGQGHQGQKRQNAAFLGAVLGGLACSVCLGNIFSIAGVAVGHATTSINK